MDADDLLDEQEEIFSAKLLEEGTQTRGQLYAMKSRKKNNEKLEASNIMIQTQSWLTDSSCSQRDVNLCCAAALERLGRRSDAICRLTEAQKMLSGDTSRKLARARLLFKDDCKAEALKLVLEVCSAFERGECCSKEAVADAYNLAGWFRIHDSDHSSGAYAAWSAGNERAPHCAMLARQKKIRDCWDQTATESTINGLVGDGAQSLTISTNLNLFH